MQRKRSFDGPRHRAIAARLNGCNPAAIGAGYRASRHRLGDQREPPRAWPGSRPPSGSRSPSSPPSSCSRCRASRGALRPSTGRSTRSPPRPGPAPRSCSAISAAAPLPYDLKVPGAEFVLALQALPIVLVMSVLTTLLFYWRILPPIVRGFAWLLERTLGVGGAVGLSTAANIFLGMVEAPLFIRPYLARADAQRAVHRDDRRHGRHRRHRAGDLRDHPRARSSPTPPAIWSSPRCWARRPRS